MQTDGIEIHTLDMHTGGEPVRIVRSGYPEIPGATILAKRRYAREHLDHLRKLLILEPRGHYDMYGVIPVQPSLPTADLAVLFIHNEGYSTMCGHAVIALARYAVDQGLVSATAPVTRVNIECPCGLVTAYVETGKGTTGKASFNSVPAFVFALNRTVITTDYGPIDIDIAYGGAFYALARADTFGMDLHRSPTRDLVDAARAVSLAAEAQTPLYHPDDPDLAFLYGTILTDGLDEYSLRATANICVFANAQVDRSPTGSGVSARLAIQHRRGLIELQQSRSFESVTGALFTGKIIAETHCGNYPAVTVQVAGKAYYIGESKFILESGDHIGRGFLLR